MSAADTLGSDFVETAKSHLSWVTIVYILCVAPIYLVWNLSPLDRWGLLLLFAGLPSSLAAFITNAVVRVAFKIGKRGLTDAVGRNAYEEFNLKLIRRAFGAILGIVLGFNLFTRQQTYGPDEAMLRLLYIPVMLAPLLPLLPISSRKKTI